MAARLEELTPGAVVDGVVAGEAATVVAVEWHGSAGVTLTYRRASGGVEHRLVYRGDEGGLAIVEQSLPWSFDADGQLFRLAAEARRIRLAYLFDPRLAVHLSLLEPLPHQIQAVYGSLLPRQPLRFALCDDPGAGKTIMAGLYLKELVLRGAVRRCLVVAPGGLVSQWQDEMADRFDLPFAILTRDMIEATQSADPFTEHHLLIARLDHLSRNDELVERLAQTEWDLVVVDEAHRMSAHYFGTELRETRRYRLGKVLGTVARHLLLMTATPHSGKEEDFQLFLALLDPDRFEGRPREAAQTPVDTSDLWRRKLKEGLLRFDGRPLFPERRATTVAYPLSPEEADLYEQVTQYVTEEMNKADRLTAEGEGRRGNRVGFAATILQRRLASSPEAIYQSLGRRRGRLEDRLAEERGQRAKSTGPPPDPLSDRGPEVDLDDEDDWDSAEREAIEEEVLDEATAARTLAELEAEIATLRRLEAMAGHVRRSGNDRKWNELVAILDDPPHPAGDSAADLGDGAASEAGGDRTSDGVMVDRAGRRRKLLVFTEHRDTLNYLTDRLRSFLGRSECVVAIHGGVRREERRRLQEVFSNDPGCLVMVATDAAGEGINLQQAHLVVNYDLPWNPNRIEQRFGRVHRIGQREVCHLWNLVADQTREGQVYVRLLEKLEAQRRALGGRVFDVLGAALPARALRELLIDAIRYGDRPDVRARLDAVVDERVGEGLAELVERDALAADMLDAAGVERIRRELLEAEARRLQPHYVRAWFSDAFTRLGGRMAERDQGRLEITRVPETVRHRGRRVLARYERVTFEKHLVAVDGQPRAELVAPGHPLLEAVLDLTLEQLGHTLRQGAILVDDADDGESPRLLTFLEHAITDGHETPAGRRVVSRRFEFVELSAGGPTTTRAYAPYLNYRAPTDDEWPLVKELGDDPWVAGDVEARSLAHAVEEAVPNHLIEVRARTEAQVAKVRAAVRDRLTKEIAHWDLRAAELREQVEAGRQPRMNPDRAQARADALSGRLKARLADLDRDQQLAALPPVVVGAALVVPAGLLARLGAARPAESGAQHRPMPAPSPVARRAVERRAVEAVLDAEDALGRRPTEMPPNNPGFDIRSEAPDGGLLFLEVKGRVTGAETFVVTRNEILHGLNVPDAWVLALVEVSPEGAEHDRVRYLRRPFGDTVHLPFATTSAVLDWRDYWSRGAAPS